MANISDSFGGTFSTVAPQVPPQSVLSIIQNLPTATPIPQRQQVPMQVPSGGRTRIQRGPSGSYPQSLQPLIFLAAISGSPFIQALLQTARQDIADGVRNGT